MFPPHIPNTVMQKVLKLNHITIQVTSNCPNTIYVTHQVYGSIKDPRNYICFIQQPFDFNKQPHILLFFNNKDLMKKIAQHLNEQLPCEYHGQEIVQHYHSGMLEEFLK